MKIRWNGHASFTLTLNDGRKIITDPFDASVGYPRVYQKADIVTVSHQHHDHNAVEELEAYGRVIENAGEYSFDGLRISALESFHDDLSGLKRGKNLIFKFEADGKTVVHLGDLGHIPDEKQLSFIKNCDIILIPIGGTYTITSREAYEIVKKAQPAGVIPMHFLTPAMSFPITDEKEFAKLTNAVYLNACEADADDIKNTVILSYQ